MQMKHQFSTLCFGFQVLQHYMDKFGTRMVKPVKPNSPFCSPVGATFVYWACNHLPSHAILWLFQWNISEKVSGTLIPSAHLFLFSAHQRGQVTTFKCTFRDGWHQFWLLYILRINEGFGIFWDVFLVAPKSVLTCFALNKTFLRQFCMTNKKHQKTTEIMYIKVYESPWSKFSLPIQKISNRTHWRDP